MKCDKLPTFRKFGKLLKYDFLESFYSILLINGILLALMAAQRFVFNGDSNPLVAVLFVVVMPVGYLLSLVFLTMTIIKLLYNRIFTADGYLTFALPVSLDAILISKILVSGAYVVVSSIVIGVWAFVISGVVHFGAISQLFEFNRIAWFLNGIVGIFSMSALVLLILSILHIGAITRFRTLCGITLFMLFMIIESLCYGMILGELESHQILPIMGLGFNALKGVLYYFVARYLIANKLEI